jgi:hypothetical protein
MTKKLLIGLSFAFINIFISSESYGAECAEKIKYEFDLDDAKDENEGVKVSSVYQEDVKEDIIEDAREAMDLFMIGYRMLKQ